MFNEPKQKQLTISVLPCDGQSDPVCVRGGRLVPKAVWRARTKGEQCIREHTEHLTQRVLWCAGLLAGGTGLTPMIRLIHTILSNLEDRVKVRRLLQRLTLDPLLQLRTFWVTRAEGVWLYSTT